MIQFIEQFLFQLSTWLHLPVFLGLLLMVGWVIWSLGAFIREWLNRSKDQRVQSFLNRNKSIIDTCLQNNAQQADIDLTELVQQWEKEENSKLDRIRVLIKIGPSLGLVGTLIPMGQALSTLSSGDMSAMANHMVTAFTATIMGLVCSIVAYFIALKKEQWLSKDFLACEAFLERKLRTITTATMDHSVTEIDDKVLTR